MNKKTTIIFLLSIALMGGILLLLGGLRFQFGSTQTHAEKRQFFSGHIVSVTGELLMARNSDTLSSWQAAIAHTRTLDFWLYDFTYQPLLKLFQQMARAGVKIRGIVENALFGNASKDFTHLQKIFSGLYAIGLHSDELLHDNFMHAKTFITDDAFTIQTANLTYSSFFNNREFFFVSHDMRIHDNLEKLFTKDRAGQKIMPEDIATELLICPIDCRGKIENILSGATRSIWMYEQYITDPAILTMLKKKTEVDKSFDLKLIVGDNSEKQDLLNTPLQAVTHVWKKPYVHAKVILVDDMYLVISSINLSANSMDENREIGIILIDSNLIKQLHSRFERDRNK